MARLTRALYQVEHALTCAAVLTAAVAVAPFVALHNACKRGRR